MASAKADTYYSTFLFTHTTFKHVKFYRPIETFVTKIVEIVSPTQSIPKFKSIRGLTK